MYLSYRQSEFSCRCVMPWKSQDKKSEKRVQPFEAKKFFAISRQIANRAKTQINNQDFAFKNNASGQTKRSLRRKKSNYSDVLESPKIKSQNQKIYREKYQENLQFHPIVSQFSNNLNDFTQQKVHLEPRQVEYRQKQIFVTPNWRQASSKYCSPEIFSIMNSHNQTPLVASPKKIHFPITSDDANLDKNMNSKSKSMKGFNRFNPTNRVVQKQFNQLEDGLIHRFDVQNPQNTHSNSFQSQNFRNSNFSLPNQMNPTNLIQKINNLQRNCKNSAHTPSQVTQPQQNDKRRFTIAYDSPQRYCKQGQQKNVVQKLNAVQFSNYSQTISRNSSNNNLIHQPNSRRVLSRDSSVKPFDQMNARKVSSIFDSRQNENEISVVIPGATLITQMSEEKEAQSPKFPKAKRRLSYGFDGKLVLKQVQMISN